MTAPLPPELKDTELKADDAVDDLAKLSKEEKLRKYCLDKAVMIAELGATHDSLVVAAACFESYIKGGKKA